MSYERLGASPSSSFRLTRENLGLALQPLSEALENRELALAVRQGLAVAAGRSPDAV